MLDQKELNHQFAINNQLCFTQSKGEQIMIDIENQYATAKVSLSGGQVLSYLPKGQQQDVLFLSDKAVFTVGKSIRGGVPICWPWFGDDTSGYGLPAHGFARVLDWNVLTTSDNDDGSTSLQLGLMSTDESLAIWPNHFELVLNITIGEQLTLRLTTVNTGKKALAITQAMHTYFNVADISQVVVQGMDKVSYLDKLDGYKLKTQLDEIIIDREVDRVYQQVPDTTTIVDNSLNRTIKVKSESSNSTVIWNPWQETGAAFADLNEDSYQHFVCIENANVFDDSVSIIPGASHTLTAIIEVESH